MSTSRAQQAFRAPVPGKGLGRLFAKSDFDPAAFCFNVLKGGHDEVDDTARAAATEMSQAETQLHEAVYASEGLSVTASRQLRSAQADVCMLSSRLSEQRSEIGKLIAAPLFSSEASGGLQAGNLHRDSNADYSACNTSSSGGLLSEKVEGCGFLGDAPGRGLLFDGQLTELDPDPPNQQLRRVHMYLLTDCIVTAIVPQHHPRSVVRNRFDRLFPLDQVAVTAAPPPAPSTRLRLLSFPESRLFDTDNGGVRVAWLHQIDIAKKSHSRNRPQDTSVVAFQRQKSEGEDGDESQAGHGSLTEWLPEALDELDVFVAERDLHSAVDSLLAIRKECKLSTSLAAALDGFSDSQTTALSGRLQQRRNELVFLLLRELDTSVVRGAYRDARLALTLLARIDKAAEATHRLLSHGTDILRNKVKQQATTGGRSSSSTTSVSRQIAENMATTGFGTIAEFVEVVRAAFASCGFGLVQSSKSSSSSSEVSMAVMASCTAALTAWVGSQTTWLAAEVYNQSTSGQQQQQQQTANLQELAECADILRRAINSQPMFSGVGLELWPLVELFLAPFTTAAVKQTQAVLVESIKKRLVVTTTAASGKAASPSLASFSPSLVGKLGVDALNKHLEACPVNIPSRVVQFGEAILNFANQLCVLYSTMQHTALCRAVTSVLRASAQQLSYSSKIYDGQTKEEIMASFKFLFGPVLDRIMMQFRKVSKLETKEFLQLQKDCYSGNPPASQLNPTPTTKSSQKQPLSARSASPREQAPSAARAVAPSSIDSGASRQARSAATKTAQEGAKRGRSGTPRRKDDEFV